MIHNGIVGEGFSHTSYQAYNKYSKSDHQISFWQFQYSQKFIDTSFIYICTCLTVFVFNCLSVAVTNKLKQYFSSFDICPWMHIIICLPLTELRVILSCLTWSVWAGWGIMVLLHVDFEGFRGVLVYLLKKSNFNVCMFVMDGLGLQSTICFIAINLQFFEGYSN